MQRVMGKSCSEPAFRRNKAERVDTIEAAHNPEVAGSNPAPAMNESPDALPLGGRGFSFSETNFGRHGGSKIEPVVFLVVGGRHVEGFEQVG
jgi:hypothetical protein